MIDFSVMGAQLFAPIMNFLSSLLVCAVCMLVLTVLLFVFSFFLLNRLNPFRMDVCNLRDPYIKWVWHDLFRWMIVDFMDRGKFRDVFKEYGFTFFVGRQGAGKTISMVHYLERMKTRYPDCLIVTNFKYYMADRVITDWRDLLTVRNGIKGVIFAIDEIHSEYSSANWKDIPESLLSEISQQRKQRVKIVATAQFFSRIAKPLREQASTVVSCTTRFGRLTSNRVYDALQYALFVDNPHNIKKKLRPLSRSIFVQSDRLRQCYDTYEKIERMKKIKFIPRNERGHHDD